MLRCICSVLAFVSLTGASGPASPVKVLQPSGPWSLDYGYTQCTALRNYGDAQGPITLGVVQSPGSDTYELFIGRHHNHSLTPEEFKGSVDFGSGPISSWLLEYSNASKVAIDQLRITSAQMEQARAAKTVLFHIKGAADSVFALSDMPTLIDGMQKCTADLQRFWNMDEKTAHIAVPSKGDVRALFTSNDYPVSAQFRAQEGTSQFLLLVDEMGSVAGCHVVVPSGVPILDAMGCAVLQARTKLQPAKDSTGKAVKSGFVTPPIKWQLED